MRTVFLGTSGFAVEVLEELARSPHRPRLVVTQPDRPRGRGRMLSPPLVADAARRLWIELLQTADVNEPEAVARIATCEPQAICVCQFGQLIQEPLLSRHLMLNVHTSLLPRWRGAAPIERALMAGDAQTGVTIFRIVAGLDSGPLALRKETVIESDDTAGSLSQRLAALGAQALIETLDLAAAGALALSEQPGEGVTYAEKIDPAERRLDPGRPAAELERKVRALAPDIGTYLELEGGERLGVGAARVVGRPLAQGAVLAEDGRLVIGTADGALELLQVTPAGRRAMAAADYLRGHSPVRPAP